MCVGVLRPCNYRLWAYKLDFLDLGENAVEDGFDVSLLRGKWLSVVVGNLRRTRGCEVSSIGIGSAT